MTMNMGPRDFVYAISKVQMQTQTKMQLQDGFGFGVVKTSL